MSDWNACDLMHSAWQAENVSSGGSTCHAKGVKHMAARLPRRLQAELHSPLLHAPAYSMVSCFLGGWRNSVPRYCSW